MNGTFRNSRYATKESVYGTQPNLFFKKFIDSHKPGRLLLPAEGEGRNAIYAAEKGWEVDAFDFSEEARSKALIASEERGIRFNYRLLDINDFKASGKYDAAGLIFVHLPKEIRQVLHKEVHNSLRSGGYLIFEAFAKEQIHFNSGGPKDPSLLYDAPTVCNDFPFLHIISCGQKEIELSEGKFHKGKASVLQLLGQKL